MYIGFDASRAVRGIRTGTEHYSANLLRELVGSLEAKRHRFSCYVNSTEQDPQALFGFPLPPHFRVRAIPFPRLWTHLRLSAEMARRPPRVLFVPAHVVPIIHPRRTVVTIHDLGYLYYPEAHTRFSRWYLHWSTIYSARAARRIIAVSAATARDLQTRYKVPAEKIHVVLHGVDSAFRRVTDPATIAEAAARHGLDGPRPYLLFVGTLQPRKNLGLLIEAFAALLKDWDATAGPTPRLALGGKKGWLYDTLVAQVERLGLGDSVRFLGYVADADLPALISGATAVVLPSLYEGFGLPALEAMACGAPLLAADASSLPEVTGDAALLLDPRDPAAWTGAMRRVLTDPALRAALSRRGPERAARFTWARTAAETLRVLEEAGRG
ncbi:MAG TPA: glycosyltransferase family 1 protein [Chloroflexia bacterium]|nr:glycosyltransferase family 1 protein [Chloroflexia bacterium]